MRPANNHDIAVALDRVAELLRVQHASSYRVSAYAAAAKTIREIDRPVHEILAAEGRAGLEALPTIGRSIAAAVEELVATGRLRLLDRLEGQVAPEDLFATIPGVGETWAHRFHDELHVETLEELELAAHDGRLEKLSGFGRRRTEALRDVLDSMLSRSARRRARRIQEAESPPWDPPDIELLLRIDSAYRVGADLGVLRQIAPKRFNPEGASWLPVLHTTEGPWHFTAMYSNTARAHARHATHDWVVIFFERDGYEDQCTVVTEPRGPLFGQRVVRGREEECRDYYAAHEDAPRRGAA